MVGVEVLVDETERSTGVSYSGGEGAAHAQPYLKQGRLQSSADGCAYKYWQRRAPALEHVLVERPEYYDVVVLGGGVSPAPETTLRSAGVKALITLSIEDGVKLKAEETWSAGGGDGAEFSKTLVARLVKEGHLVIDNCYCCRGSRGPYLFHFGGMVCVLVQC